MSTSDVMTTEDIMKNIKSHSDHEEIENEINKMFYSLQLFEEKKRTKTIELMIEKNLIQMTNYDENVYSFAITRNGLDFVINNYSQKNLISEYIYSLTETKH